MTLESNGPFESALAALLGPLAQAMIAHGVTIGTANEALKNALLQAAVANSGTEMSDSQASLLTGIHRKDIKRLRHADEDETPRRSSNAAALVISHWATDPEFQSSSGAPLNVPRTGGTSTPGFDSIVRKSRVDMAPGTVLNALLEQEIVIQLEDDTYKLLTRTFLPKPGSLEQVAAYQATLSAHIVAATQNLLSDENVKRHFDRVVRYSHLSQASVEALQEIASTKAQALLQEINEYAQDMQNNDQDGETDGKFVFGAYILPSSPSPKED
ncbi:MAG: DUF6502 family protein [Sulfitobacter sp.]